ncbi:MAG: restriction endonuclease subunit S [Pseudomonadota bacterium]
MSLGYIGDSLPKDWCTPLLSELATPKQWKTIPTKSLLSEGYTVYGANGKIGYFDQYTHKNPTIMITCRGATCGNLHISEPFSYINGNAMALDDHPTKLAGLKFLYFALKARGLEDTISGSAQPQITGKGLSEVRLPLPPLAEQKVIADKLDTLLAQVKNTKARLERIPQILKRFRQSVLAAAVSGRLTEEWRKDKTFERVSVAEIKQCHRDYVLAKAKKYSVPARFQEGDIACHLPESWEWFRAEELCDLITKGTTPSKIDMSGSGHVPFIKVYNLTFDGTLDFSVEPTFISKHIHENALKRSKAYPGDVLMNIVGPPLGKVSIVPDTFPEWNLNQAISIFRPVCGVTPGYLALCLRDYALLEQTKRKAKATAGQFNLTLEICRDYSVPVPPLKEQTEIVRRVDQLFAHADRIEQQVNNALDRVNKLTQSILAKAFRGELTEQWRKDNPELISGENSAEALLERIKAEKAASKPAKKARKQTTA